MSLLIDALKQAEASRAQSPDAPSPDAGVLQLEPLPTPPSAGPAISKNQSPATAETGKPRPPRRPQSASGPSEAAKSLFEVKQQAPSRFPLIVAGIAVIALLAGSIYVWWAMQPHSSLVGSSLRTSAVERNPQMPAQPMQAAAPANSSQKPLPENAESISTTDTPPVRPTVREPARRARTTAHVIAPASASTSIVDDGALHIRKAAPSNDDTASASPLQSAYAALQEGKLALATQRYQEVLRQDPRNLDAINALGFIAWRNGQPDTAERMFRLALQINPTDATASSQLAMLYASADPAQAEARLRTLVASQPTSSAAHYALGELLAREGRWQDAQQSLFQAYTLDSNNPDILFNLAVSLDHLKQVKLARQFYERALGAASQRPASFDSKQAQARIQALGGS